MEWFRTKRGEILIRCLEEIHYSEGGEAPAQAAQRSCACLNPGGSGADWWGSGLHELVRGSHVHRDRWELSGL